MPLHLTTDDRAKLHGEDGQGVALAMRVVVRLAETMGAAELLDISGAHIDSCLHHGQAGLDFAQRLVAGGAKVTVPTTLNVSSLDLLHPELYRGDPTTAAEARQLMRHYEELGCEPTWTCAPYQRQERPALGDHIAWAESNAIVFANSVLGARTHRYGDFIDIAAAITGRAPNAGLHRDEHRRATIIVDVTSLGSDTLARPELPEVLGLVVGQVAQQEVPVIVGLPHQSEDQLKGLGSAAASSGSVGMFHVVGSTPEAPMLERAVGRGIDPSHVRRVAVSSDMLAQAADSLSAQSDVAPTAISLGTPHYSVTQFGRLVELLRGRSVADGMAVYVSTGREIVTELDLRGWLDPLEAAGIQLVTDTCTYITPVMAETTGAVMTDSAKWAYYAPGNLGVQVHFASTADCVETAVTGRWTRTEQAW